MYVQIQGYNIGTDAPDQNILATTSINISTPGWHLQTFEEEISLTTGSYYLVINGSELFPTDKSTYNWFYNTSGSLNTNLNTALYDGDWKQDDIGEPFLYKLVQRVNRSFNPEEVNMTAEFNGSSYPILDGTTEGTGNLTINELIAPNATQFNIMIGNNRSIGLIFNLSYSVKLINQFFSDGQLELKDSSVNRWTLTPDFTKVHYNYTVKFNYPSAWYNFSVKRNGLDITPNVTINVLDNYILIPNDILIVGASWEISANSPNIALALNTPKLKFEPNQDLEFLHIGLVVFVQLQKLKDFPF